MLKAVIAIIGAAFLICFSGCVDNVQKDSTVSQIFNPNGDSELALLMRDMFDDGMQVKQQLLNGGSPQIRSDFQKIHTAQATQPEKVSTPNYTAFGQAYESAANAFLESDPNSKPEAYQAMVTACMSCHKSICPGPMVKIKKLFLSEKEMQALTDAF